MTALIAPVAIVMALALCYLLARAHFDTLTSLLAVGAVTIGGPLAWHALALGNQDYAMRLLSGTVAAYLAARATTRVSDLTAVGVSVALGLIAMRPYADGSLSLEGFAPADVLWSSRGGLLATSPALYLAVLGWLLLWRTHRRLAITGSLLLFAVVAFVAAHHTWWVGARPSPAAFAVVTPYLVFGAAALIDALSGLARRHPLPIVTVGLGLLVVWNITLMGVTRAGGHRIGEPVSFGHLGEQQARRLHDWIGHPASYPANLAYAVRNGVSPAAYDVLAPLAWLGGSDRQGAADVGGDDGLLVEGGWHARERDGDRSFRWATETAALRVPLARTADVVVMITLRPFEAPGGAAQQLTLVVNDHVQSAMTLVPGWQTVTLPVPRALWRTGVNRLVLRFTTQTRPLDVGAADPRWLSAAVDTVAIEVR